MCINNYVLKRVRNKYKFDYCNSGCPCREESSVKLSTAQEILVIESSICSVTTVHAAPEYTTVTVAYASAYTSSCPSASLEDLTALATVTCTGNPDASTTDQIAINKTSSTKTSVEQSTKTVTKTVVLTSTPSSFSCKDISTLLVTVLPPSVDDLGYVETAECTRF